MPQNVENYVEKMPKQRGRCTSCICMSWKVFTCVLSHVILVTMVIAYCLLGAQAFQYLEAENELQMKNEVKYIRLNLSSDLWSYTQKLDYLKKEEWTKHAAEELQDFEKKILETMKTGGWDGSEDTDKLQWTNMGALFYSIIVITTIGYGHIAPKTDAGKIMTIFYAIIGIPLMLLCLSNIGDIMASSFRFIYWRVCCFVCTREPKRRPRRPDFMRTTSHHSSYHSARPSIRSNVRRSVRVSQRTADSGIDTFYEPRMSHAHSDPDLRYTIEDDMATKRQSYNHRSQRFSRHKNRDRFRQERHTLERERVADRSSKKYNSHSVDRSSRPRGQSQRDRSGRAHSMARCENNYNHSIIVPEVNVRDYTMTLPASRGRHRARIDEKRARSVDPRTTSSKDDAPILCNRYAIEDLLRRESLTEEREKRARSMPRSQNHRRNLYSPSREVSPEPIPKRLSANDRSRYLAPPIAPEMHEDSDSNISEMPVRKQRRREKTSLPPSPRIMSPMGFAIHRQARLMESFDEEAVYDDDHVDFVSDVPVRPVPIWLCVFLVISYIIGGAIYFSKTENWNFLDSAYFCFITLTTIGFGDFVPAQGLNVNVTAIRKFDYGFIKFDEQEVKIAGCSLYLLFGISLLAMSFNLVQEEVIANVKNVARQLGILKEEDSDY